MTNRPRLSTRELEIATLAATGLTNREIATGLVLSVRTVENHLAGRAVEDYLAGRPAKAALVESNPGCHR